MRVICHRLYCLLHFSIGDMIACRASSKMSTAKSRLVYFYGVHVGKWFTEVDKTFITNIDCIVAYGVTMCLGMCSVFAEWLARKR